MPMDTEAESAIRDAFRDPPPHNVRTIPGRATEILNDPQRGSDRIYEEIAEMVKSGKIIAPAEPWKDWHLT